MDAFGTSFDVAPGYLDTPSVGVPPRFVARAVRAAVDDWATAATSAPEFDAAVETARAAVAGLIPTAPASVAIGSTVSGLLGLVAGSLPPRCRVVTAEREFTSVSWPFAACGAEVVEVPLADVPERAAGFDVVAVSVVASADGAVLDVEALRAATAGTDVLVLLDATQSLGWLPADLGWADAVAVGGYKWLLSPRGAAWMAVSDRLRERTVASGAGWYAGASRWESTYGLPMRLAPDARRLDVSPVWLAHVGAAVAVPWLASLDPEAVRSHDVGLADRVRDGLGLAPTGSAIVSIRRDGAAERLAAGGVRAAARDGAARVGFHLHSTEADADAVLEVLG